MKETNYFDEENIGYDFLVMEAKNKMKELNLETENFKIGVMKDNYAQNKIKITAPDQTEYLFNNSKEIINLFKNEMENLGKNALEDENKILRTLKGISLLPHNKSDFSFSNENVKTAKKNGKIKIIFKNQEVKELNFLYNVSLFLEKWPLKQYEEVYVSVRFKDFYIERIDFKFNPKDKVIEIVSDIKTEDYVNGKNFLSYYRRGEEGDFGFPEFTLAGKDFDVAYSEKENKKYLEVYEEFEKISISDGTVKAECNKKNYKLMRKFLTVISNFNIILLGKTKNEVAANDKNNFTEKLIVNYLNLKQKEEFKFENMEEINKISEYAKITPKIERFYEYYWCKDEIGYYDYQKFDENTVIQNYDKLKELKEKVSFIEAEKTERIPENHPRVVFWSNNGDAFTATKNNIGIQAFEKNMQLRKELNFSKMEFKKDFLEIYIKFLGPDLLDALINLAISEKINIVVNTNDEKICFDFSKNIINVYPYLFSESGSFLMDNEILKQYRKRNIAILFNGKL